MKDKNLRKALGIHGFEENLCGCDMVVVRNEWGGEIPMLWKKVKELEKEVEIMKQKIKKVK